MNLLIRHQPIEIKRGIIFFHEPEGHVEFRLAECPDVVPLSDLVCPHPLDPVRGKKIFLNLLVIFVPFFLKLLNACLRERDLQRLVNSDPLSKPDTVQSSDLLSGYTEPFRIMAERLSHLHPDDAQGFPFTLYQFLNLKVA